MEPVSDRSGSHESVSRRSSADRSGSDRLDVVGIGSMVVDRVHRSPRILGDDEKCVLRDVDGAGPVRPFVGGVVLNHLGWAAALGLRAGVFGRQGDDADGRFLRAAMGRLGIERDLELVEDATSLAEIFVDDAGGRAIYMAPGATSNTTAETVRRHEAFLRRAGRLTTEVSQLPLEAALAALEIARGAGIPTVVDFDVPPSDAIGTLGDDHTLEAVARAADLLKPAKRAAREIAPEAGTDPLALARAVRARFGNEAVVVTDGEAGCAIAADGFEGFVPAQRVKALDTTGAGDAFLGGLLAGLHDGLSWRDAALLANACGAACVEKLGAFPDDPDEARARVAELTGRPLPRRSVPVSQPAAPDGGHESAALFGVALAEASALHERLDVGAYEAAVEQVCAAREKGGRVHVTGSGKSEHAARYAAALLSSTGTPATFLHATEVVHGSAGQVLASDVVIAVSNSGTTEELLRAVGAVQEMGARVIAVTGDPASPLAQRAAAVLDAGVAREGGPLGLAPRASFVAASLVLAALAAALERATGFTRADYAARHPAGDLGTRSRRGRQGRS